MAYDTQTYIITTLHKGERLQLGPMEMPVARLQCQEESQGLIFEAFIGSYSSETHSNSTLSNNTQVLTENNVLDFVEKVETDYISAYKNNEEMAKVDFVYCGYPASLCQVYDKLNKSVFVQATTRWMCCSVCGGEVLVCGAYDLFIECVNMIMHFRRFMHRF